MNPRAMRDIRFLSVPYGIVHPVSMLSTDDSHQDFGGIMTQFLKTFIPGRPMRLPLLTSAAALAILPLLLSGCARDAAGKTAPKMGTMPVDAVVVRQANVPLTGNWVGTLDGFVDAQIQPQVSGYLVRQEYREGSVVRKGEVLFQIDPRPFQAAVDQAQAQVEQAQGQLAQAEAQRGLAQINLKRDTPLAQAHAIAQSQLDNDVQTRAQNEASVASAKASVAAAEAAVENAQLNLGFTHVRSLITGVAGQATTQVGNLVNTQSVLTAVSQLDPIKVYFSISDAEYLALIQRARNAGGDLLKNENAIPLTLTLANNETYPLKGHIEFVDRQMNAQTGAIRIAAVFPNPKNVLRPGQFGRVRGETQLHRNGILVPQVAVLELQGLQQVYVAGADNKAHLTTIELGPQIGNNWLVQGGLTPGAKVIVDNLQKLREGAPVNPHPAAAPVASASNAAPNAAGR
jgi:membrane fusion protein, multidrug efflux system